MQRSQAKKGTAPLLSRAWAHQDDSDTAMSRLAKEYAQLQGKLSQPQYDWVCGLEPASEESLSSWRCEFVGPEDSAYAGFRFTLEIEIEVKKYPMYPPVFRFVPKSVVHPNVKWETGEICLDLLKESWTPLYGLLDVVEGIRHLLAEPGLDSPLDLDMAHLYQADYEAYVQIVKYRLVERDYDAVYKV